MFLLILARSLWTKERLWTVARTLFVSVLFTEASQDSTTLALLWPFIMLLDVLMLTKPRCNYCVLNLRAGRLIQSGHRIARSSRKEWNEGLITCIAAQKRNNKVTRQ